MKKTCVLLLLMSLAISILCCGCSGSGRAVDKFKTQVQNNQYLDALDTYSKKIYGNSALELEAANFLKEYLNSAWQGYLAETVSSAEFEAILQTIERIDESINKLGWTIREIQVDYPEVAASKEAYQKGVEKMEGGDLEGALASLSQVDSVDQKNYQDAQTRLEQVEALYIREIVQTAQGKIDAGDYSGAMTIVQTAERTIGYRSEFNELRGGIATAEFEKKMNLLAEENDFSSMYALYNEALDDIDCTISAAMTNLLAEAQQRFRQDIIDRSVTAYKSSGYEAAIPIINEGLSVLSEDEKLLKYYELYKSCIPVYLTDLPVIDKQWGAWDDIIIQSNDSVTDAYYNDYHGYIKLVEGNASYPVSVEFLLNRSYTTIQAKCFVNPNAVVTDGIQICIYADDILVYSSGEMSKKTDAKSIELDVTSVRVLKVEINSPSGQPHIGAYVAEPILSRTLTDTDLNG